MKAEKLLLLCVVLGASWVILRSIPLFLNPYQIDYGEGLMMEGALRLHHSQPLYPNPFTFPVVLHVYGPVAYAMAASVLPIGAASFPAGRLLILACSIAVSLLLATILHRLTGSWWIGLSFGFLLLTLPAFRFWLYLLRADVIGIAFSMAGVALYLFANNKTDNRWYWSILFFGIALFCKYSLLAAPVAVFVHLLVSRRLKPGIAYVAGLSAACALALAGLQFRTGGWFAFHQFSTHPDRYSLLQFFALAALVLASAPVSTALAAWYAVQDFRAGSPGFPSIYLAVSSLTALTAGKLGSTTNHFSEWMVACCLCAGLGYSRVLSKYARGAMPVTALLSASVLAGILMQNRTTRQPAESLAECGRAYRYVTDSPASRVLSENLGPLLVAGKSVTISDPFVYGQLVKHGRWPDHQIEDLLNRRYFDLVVMSDDPSQMKAQASDVWPDSLVNAMDHNYRVVDRFECRDARVMLEPVASPAAPGDVH